MGFQQCFTVISCIYFVGENRDGHFVHLACMYILLFSGVWHCFPKGYHPSDYRLLSSSLPLMAICWKTLLCLVLLRFMGKEDCVSRRFVGGFEQTLETPQLDLILSWRDLWMNAQIQQKKLPTEVRGLWKTRSAVSKPVETHSADYYETNSNSWKHNYNSVVPAYETRFRQVLIFQ